MRLVTQPLKAFPTLSRRSRSLQGRRLSIKGYCMNIENLREEALPFLSKGQIRKEINKHFGASLRKTSEHIDLLNYVLKRLGVEEEAPKVNQKICRIFLNIWLVNKELDPKELFVSCCVYAFSWKAEKDIKKIGKVLAYDEHKFTICNLPSEKFYNSPEWSKIRYKTLSNRGNRCECCGRSPKNGVVIHVDHIKPRSIFPELALEEDNLQILCDQCNIAKSNSDETDWRVK